MGVLLISTLIIKVIKEYIMQFKIIIVLLILLLCVLAFGMVVFIKAKSTRLIIIAICGTAAVAIALTRLFIYDNSYIKDFSAFSIDDLSYSNEMIESVLSMQVGDNDAVLMSADDLENRIVIGTFYLHFRNNSFSNLQFAIISSENGGPLEKVYQINYEGQVFSNPETLVLPEILFDNTLSLRELKNVIEILSKSYLIQDVSASASNSVNVVFNGHINTLSDAKNLANAYIIQDENVIPLSHTIPQEENGYYVFSIVSDVDYIQILCPLYTL